MNKLVVFILVFFPLISFSQEKGIILAVVNVDAEMLIDGDLVDTLTANSPQKFETTSGQHYIQIVSLKDRIEKNEILEVELGKQIVLKFDFDIIELKQQQPVKVIEQKIKVPGLLLAAATDDFEYPTYLYGFEKGDEIILDLMMESKSGTNFIEIFNYPDLNIIYSNDQFGDLENLRLSINERSIYGIKIGSNHAFDREVNMTIQRIPGSLETKYFNTNVIWQDSYEVHTIQESQKFYLNSRSNSNLLGGKSRIAVPIKLPLYTVKWYYEFSASRNEEEINRVRNSFNLLGELSQLVDGSGVLKTGIEMLTQPPGSDYCDIYLINHQNHESFLNKQDQVIYFTEGTRENYKSGIVEVSCCLSEQLYLGISNPTMTDGVHVAIDVVAITKKSDWVMVGND